MPLTLSLFPKFLKHLRLEELAVTVRQCGFDTVNLVVRNGFWVTPENLTTAAPEFVQAMNQAGIPIRLATAAYEPEELRQNPEPLRVLADAGIEAVRIGYFPLPKQPGLLAYQSAGETLAVLSNLARDAGIRILYQLHHRKLLNASTAILLAQSLAKQPVDAEWLQYMVDPGNQFHEGREDIGVSIGNLGKQLGAIGVKDLQPVRTADGTWQFPWAPLQAGLLDWQAIVNALPSSPSLFAVFMPFYHQHDPDTLIQNLTHEVRYFRDILNPPTS